MTVLTMRRPYIVVLVALLTMAAWLPTHAQVPSSTPAGQAAAASAPTAVQPETPEQAARLAWFREAKFGLFIHWGLYAIPAGEWKGQPVAGIDEWIMNRAKIPVKDAARVARGRPRHGALPGDEGSRSEEVNLH